MENTEKVLFEDDSPQWYLAMGERWIGPISASDVYERVMSQQITWAHFVWKPGQAEWKRLCDVKTFKAAVPQQPPKKLQNEVKEVSKPNIRSSSKQSPPIKTAQKRNAENTATRAMGKLSDERGWFLYFNDSQFGPFTKEEVSRFLSIGKITPRVHAWKGGMANWVRLQDIEAFEEVIASEVKSSGTMSKSGTGTKTKIPKPEQRFAPRRPMVARILMHNNRAVSEAMCRDISVGGMQVLTDVLPGAVGSKIRLNVSSAAIDPFVAEGEIVRILEDNKGFSFRFDRLSDSAKKAIEKYIQS
jgi:hypothetical protein